MLLDASWNKEVDIVCEQIRRVLAPGAKKVTAELYKLLIYRKGDFFRLHQDTQYSAHMFASLLFFIPVKYTGGEFHIFEPGNDNVVHIRDRKVSGMCSWLAFYTDVRHQVQEITEGFRVALNYCVSFEGAMCPSPCLPRMSQSATSAIKDYFTVNKKKMLAIPLVHEYTQATLTPDFLKGIDAYVFNTIEEIAHLKLHFVLLFDKTKAVYYDYGDIDNERVFQGVFLVPQEMEKRYFEVQSAGEQQLAEIDDDDDYSKSSSVREKRNDKYLALMEEVKAAQADFDLEWMVERKKSGQPNQWSFGTLSFEYGRMGWLGNMCPAEEYYYLKAAMIVRGIK